MTLATSARHMGVAALAFAAIGQAVAAESFYASSERFGYFGTVTVYDTLEDAEMGINPRYSTIMWPQRDGAIFLVRNVPDYWVDSNVLMTNWFANNGASNPSNTNMGFFQLYDDNADSWKNQNGNWSPDLNTFTVRAAGRDASYGPPGNELDYARLWNAGAPAGSGEATRGTFLTYQYRLTATGLNGFVDTNGYIRNSTNATDFSGFFRGIFRNESTNYPASNGFYVFDLKFNNVSWAASNNYGWNGPCLPDDFAGTK